MTPEDARFLAPGPDAEIGDANALRRKGLRVAEYLVLPEVVLPLDQPEVFRYALYAWALPPSRAKSARNAVLARVVEAGLFRRGGERVAVGSTGDLTPRLVRAAEGLGAGTVGGWLYTPGRSDALSRSVFHLFEPGAAKPHAVLKFARTPGYTAPFDRDARALALVAAAGGSVAAHAPRLVGRGEVDGLAVSVESAAPGPRLLSYLTSNARLADRRAALLRVARWTVDVGRETARDGRVFAHNDLGPWNVLVDGRDHVAVDWESADPAGLPLNDLTYVLFHGLANLAGRTPGPEFFRDLFGGSLADSRLVFDLVTEYAAATGLPDSAIGHVVTESWRRHGGSQIARGAALAAHAPGAPAAVTVLAECARVWETDPALGPGWSARTAAGR